MRRLAPAVAGLLLAACAGVAAVVPPDPAGLADAGWIPAAASARPAGLGLPGGARLEDGVRFAGGLELVLDEASPLHSLSDLKLLDEAAFVSVSDAGDLVRGRLRLDPSGRLAGVEGLAVRRLTLADGAPIVEKADGDAEGLAVDADGDLLVSFERDHRIWNYGDPRRPASTPVPVRMPDAAFASNDGMEGLAAGPAGWRVSGESGGVWDCTAIRCAVVVAPGAPVADGDYRITGIDRDPSGAGYFVVQRSFSPPVDARARVRRMDRDGTLGPVLIELKLPGTTDNFEGIAARSQGGSTRLYILSDDNNNAAQRTLLLAFDVASDR
ncbi:esterase-like activity of phytase family protein [Brevundimonas sp.]|uniref:esterase-like activity of phytase family protein n=1 Tax=Brevundimonas sp. TaxID=1871086 RepID=UPI0027379932|nr:esterase-like activity of phytase family protein [Brevundimonas sp.]MDP3802655.1 esterase-like activity of phytase family protein [Brevundimonas sp.]